MELIFSNWELINYCLSKRNTRKDNLQNILKIYRKERILLHCQGYLTSTSRCRLSNQPIRFVNLITILTLQTRKKRSVPGQ